VGLIDKLVGVGKSLIDGVADGVDRFVQTADEKTAARAAAEAAKREYELQIGAVVAEYEKGVEETVRSEIAARRDVMLAEIQQGDNFTKRARPTVIYSGLVVIVLGEILGLRYIVLQHLVGGTEAVFQQILDASNQILSDFLWVWAGVVGVYTIGRSAEKRGAMSKWVSRITGNETPAPPKSLEDQLAGSVRARLRGV